MAVVAWPNGDSPNLPNYPNLGFATEMPAPVVQSQMKTGPAKTRSESTFQRTLYSVAIELDYAQYATWLTFWANIDRGADAFSWIDFIDESACEYKIDTSRPIRPVNVCGGAKTARRWQIAFTVEKQV